VISQARTVLSETGKIARQVQSRIDASTDELRVAVLPTIAAHLLPQLIPRLTHLFPRVAFLFQEALMDEIQERIINHRLDVGIAVPPRATRGLRVEPLYSEALVAYVSEGHRFSVQRTIRADDLSLEDLWLPPSGYPLREATIALCKNANVEVPRPVRYDCGNLETVKRLVEQNQGMAVLPVSAVQGGLFYRNDLVKHFDEPVPDRQVCAVYARTSLKAELIEILSAEIMRAVSSPQISVRRTPG
jgi:LysR family hydrogen peroxide-inducible transcriptional activator